MKTLNYSDSVIVVYPDTIDIHGYTRAFAPKYPGKCAISGKWFNASTARASMLADDFKIRMVRLEGWDKPRPVLNSFFKLLSAVLPLDSLTPKTVADKDDDGFDRDHGQAMFSPNFAVEELFAHLDNGGKIEAYGRDGVKKTISATGNAKRPYKVGWNKTKTKAMMKRTLDALVLVKRSSIETAIVAPVAAPVAVEDDSDIKPLDHMTDAFCVALEAAIAETGSYEVADILAASDFLNWNASDEDIETAVMKRDLMIAEGVWNY